MIQLQYIYTQKLLLFFVAKMSQQIHPLYKPVYYLHRANSPKNTTNQPQSTKNVSLTMSIGANETASNFLQLHKNRTEVTDQPSSQSSLNNPQQKQERLQFQLRNIKRQNMLLKQQNQVMRKELVKIKKEPVLQNSRGNQKHTSLSPGGFNDLRGTIKREMGEMKEIRLKLDMLSKQCQMYEEIIQKMDERIKKLTAELNKRNMQIDDMQTELTKFEQLKEKTNGIMRCYSDLQSKFNSDQLNWMKWKQSWLSEKQFYLQRIHQLEKLVGYNYK